MIWVLKGSRTGDTAQAMQLALQLGGRVESKQLSFNSLYTMPNWLFGARVSHLNREAKTLVGPPWPDLVVATGRRTAPVAVWIKRQSGGVSKIVQIGRPRMALKAFDLVVTSPQYGLPAAENVVEVPLPFAVPKSVATTDLKMFGDLWSDLPRPWILGVIGGAKFPLRLNSGDLENFGLALSARATAVGGGVILLDSPRSPPGASDVVRKHISAPCWQHRRGPGSNPYQPALQMSDQLVVTSDSVSMVSEMLLTGKPVFIFRLPVSRLTPRWSAQSGLGAALARTGVLSPPRNVDLFMSRLLEAGYVGDLAAPVRTTEPPAIEGLHAVVVDRVRSLLNSSSSL